MLARCASRSGWVAGGQAGATAGTRRAACRSSTQPQFPFPERLFLYDPCLLAASPSFA